MDKTFWQGKKVFLTGHTGFKGTWLALWLHALGADVTGYALAPPTEPALFTLCRLNELVRTTTADIRDLDALTRALRKVKPEIIIHLAAQPLVRESYLSPVLTYETNILGTVHLLEGVRRCDSGKAIVNVTSDKCYGEKPGQRGYQENDPMGGFDPYSSSKGCAELITAAYRNSFFHPANYSSHGTAVATARAGNVIGGGDWAKDRLLPDCVRALLKGEPIVVRNPNAVRPWQHVLEPLSGYLTLARRLYENGPEFGGGWNFSPDDTGAKTVLWIVQEMCRQWPDPAAYEISNAEQPYEAHSLKLDSSKAKTLLSWRPKWSIEQAIDKILEWTVAYQENADVRQVCLNQIAEYSHGGS